MPLTSIEELLTRHGLAPGSLMIELAGLDPRIPLDELERRLKALRRLGVRFALDGFGTGYGSIVALRRLPVEVLKLDRSLVDGVVESARLHKITSGLLRIAADLGMQTVADGVDQPDQVGALRAMGCTHGMGGAFSAPLDEYRIRRLLAEGRCTVPAARARPGGHGGAGGPGGPGSPGGSGGPGGRTAGGVASRGGLATGRPGTPVTGPAPGHAPGPAPGHASGPASGAAGRPQVPTARTGGAAYAGLQHGGLRPHSETVVPPT
jgi:hypothetical protein